MCCMEHIDVTALRLFFRIEESSGLPVDMEALLLHAVLLFCLFLGVSFVKIDLCSCLLTLLSFMSKYHDTYLLHVFCWLIGSVETELNSGNCVIDGLLASAVNYLDALSL